MNSCNQKKERKIMKETTRKGGREEERKKGREKEDLYLSFLMFYHQSILMCNVLLGSFWSPNSVPLCPGLYRLLSPFPQQKSLPHHLRDYHWLAWVFCLLACLLRSILFLNCMYAGVSVFIHVHSGTHESHSGVGSPSWSYS